MRHDLDEQESFCLALGWICQSDEAIHGIFGIAGYVRFYRLHTTRKNLRDTKGISTQ